MNYAQNLFIKKELKNESLQIVAISYTVHSRYTGLARMLCIIHMQACLPE